MSESRSAFLQKPQITFVNYGTNRDLSYRKEARKHNARIRVVSRTCRRQEPAKESQHHQSQLSEPPVVGSAMTLLNGRPHDALSSFRRDRFCCHPVEMNSDEYHLESIWFSKFQDIFFLPQLPPHSRLVRPQERVFAASIESSASFQGLVLIAAAAATAYSSQNAEENLLHRQAKSLQQYRELIDRYYKLKRSWGPGYRDILALTFGFANDRDAAAYNEMQYTNFDVVSRYSNGPWVSAPVIEWIRTLMPTPTPAFNGESNYKEFLKDIATKLFEFLEDAQSLAVAQSVAQSYNAHRVNPFRRGTALHRIITTTTRDYSGPQPFPGFYQLCRVRILTHIHLFMLHQRNLEIENEHDVFQILEDLAAQCVPYGDPTSTALFFWALLTTPNVCTIDMARREKFMSMPSKDLLSFKGMCFADEMAAWLLQEPDEQGIIQLPILDFKKINEFVQQSL